MWRQTFQNNLKQVSSVDMILMDEEGKKQATINLVTDFEFLLEEGRIRVISNFGIASNARDYMLVSHPCKINFYKTTKVEVSSDFKPTEGVDVDGYHFSNFSDLIEKKVDSRVSNTPN